MTHPQFYAEDGHVWFADAYNRGWFTSLFLAFGGYIQVLPRIGAAFALLLPYAFVPLFLNSIAFAFQALPVNFLISHRSASLGKLKFRMMLAAVYLALPNSYEVFSGITNAHWLLAVTALILLVASTPKSNLAKALDCGLMILCGLSGPFCIFLLPLSVFVAWKDRQRWRWIPVAIYFLTTSIQAHTLLFVDPAARSHMRLGANVTMFIRFLGGQIYLATVLGMNPLTSHTDVGSFIFLLIVAIGGTGLFVFTVIKSPMALKVFLLFSAMLLAASLVSPVEWEWGHPELTVWDLLSRLPGLRYWFFMTLSFAWVLIWCANQHHSRLASSFPRQHRVRTLSAIDTYPEKCLCRNKYHCAHLS
jgi:hypothetical protein